MKQKTRRDKIVPSNDSVRNIWLPVFRDRSIWEIRSKETKQKSCCATSHSITIVPSWNPLRKMHMNAHVSAERAFRKSRQVSKSSAQRNPLGLRYILRSLIIASCLSLCFTSWISTYIGAWPGHTWTPMRRHGADACTYHVRDLSGGGFANRQQIELVHHGAHLVAAHIRTDATAS